MRGLLDFGASLFKEDPLIDAAVRSYLTYFSVKKLGNGEMVAVYLLDPRYRLQYLTENAIDMALSAILKVGVKSGLNLARARRLLIAEFSSFCECEGDYSTEPGIRSAYEW